MELSCESLRNPEDRRPASCKFVELHVLCVPDDQWDVKLNKVPAEAIERFISAGFIRVSPDVTLKTLRSELGALLGAEMSIDKFSFLKCVGRSLALVKSKQEHDMKVKTFAPPYAPQPELYLLPTVENDSSVCCQSLTSDTSSSSSDHQTYYHPPKLSSLPAGTKKPIKFPLIHQRSHQPHPTQSLEEEEEEEEQSFSSSEAEHEEEGPASKHLEWAEQECYPRQAQNQRAPWSVSQNTALQNYDADSAQVKKRPEEEEETCVKKNQHQKQNGHFGEANDRHSGFSVTDRQRNTKDAPALRSMKNKPTTEVTGSPAALSRPFRRVPPRSGLHSATAASPISHIKREELTEEIKAVRDQRKQLEWTRQELLRKGKDLVSQNRHRRIQARDSWKKKYFETKKATAPLEEKLRNLQQQMEMFYNKLLHQLQARDNKQKHHARSSVKNELIIQIMTENHDIDNLKRKLEDAKMKLVTEIKLRKQAATELRALKAELAQKKSQSSVPTASLGKVQYNST